MIDVINLMITRASTLSEACVPIPALKEWCPLAGLGSAEAQSMPGVFYATGNGVLHNNEFAHMWYNLAATNGFEKVGKW